MTRQRKRKSRYAPHDYGADVGLGFDPEVPFKDAELTELRRLADQLVVGRNQLKRDPENEHIKTALDAIEKAFADLLLAHNAVRYFWPFKHKQGHGLHAHLDVQHSEDGNSFLRVHLSEGKSPL